MGTIEQLIPLVVFNFRITQIEAESVQEEWLEGHVLNICLNSGKAVAYQMLKNTPIFIFSM